MVQGIEFPNGDYMIMNEEGKLLGLPVNEEATTVVANYIHKRQVLVWS